MIEEKRMYFAAKAFIVQGNKFLAMHKKSSEEEYLELPGGRVEFGESLEDTLKREIFEETKLSFERIKLLDTWEFIGENYQIVGVIYLCRVIEGKVILSEEHDYYKWLEINDDSMDKLHRVYRDRLVNLGYGNIKESVKEAKIKNGDYYDYPF
ncbi:NUDIX domain-containing protein [Clostridium sp.]|uniref:NUDIX hydrolase n=1 Tax=Clostridium sp. TaxID=1506 RepID=UPI003463FAA9